MLHLYFIIIIYISELRENILIHVQNIFYESNLNMKCEIIRSLQKLITNFVSIEYIFSIYNISFFLVNFSYIISMYLFNIIIAILNKHIKIIYEYWLWQEYARLIFLQNTNCIYVNSLFSLHICIIVTLQFITVRKTRTWRTGSICIILFATRSIRRFSRDRTCDYNNIRKSYCLWIKHTQLQCHIVIRMFSILWRGI